MQLRRLSSDKKSLTAAELNTIAEVSKLSYANCRLWYQQNGVVVPPEVKSDATRVKVEERNVKVGFAIIEKHGNLSDSQRRAKMFMSSQRRSFFYNLPYEDQLYLLRKTEHMTSTSHQLAEEMSLKLKLPVDKISAWLKQRRKRILKVEADSDVKVSNVKSILLCAEFACDKEIDEDKALILAFWFNLSKKAILGWYKKQQAQYRFREKQKATKDVVVEDKPKPTAIKVDSSKLPVVSFSKTEEDLYGNQKKTPAQLNVLFEAFKKYSGKLYSHIDELAKQTGLSEGAVRDWIGKTNGVLRTKTMTTVTKKLRENFTTAQVRALQKEYRKRKYITRNEANEIALSTNLNSSKVMQWFNSRRVHELFSHYPSSASKNGNSGQHITERETSPPPPPDSGMSRVVIQKSSSKRRGNRGNGIPAFKVLRLLKDRRRCGNKKAFSKLAKELGLHEKQISSWLRNKQYREQMIHRAKLVYGEALKDHEDTSTENRPTASSNLLVQLTSDEDLKSSSNEPILASPEDTMTTGIQHSCLFNAYKESRSLSEARIQELSDRSNMDKLKIKNWWNAIGKHMRRKNIEVLETFLMTSCNDEQREKLINLYSKARYYSKAYLTRMAEQIGMNSKTVHSWFINARLYELKTGAKFKRTSTSHSDVACEDTAFTSNLAWPEIQKLKQEFQKDATMTDARARSLAIRLKVQCDKIKEWFENRQQFITECSEKITDDHTNAGNSSSVDYEVTVEEEVIDAEPTTGNNETLPSVLVRLPKITPNSLNAPSCSENFTSASQETQINHSRPKELLFKEFLKGSRLTPARLQQIAYASNMDQKHICKWFSWLRSKVAKLSEDVLSDNYRNENLIDEQVNVLESEFLVTPYPDQETKETLSQQLGVSRAVVKTWFANRRYYEILTNSVVPAFSVPTMSKLGVDFKPVITSISSAKQLSNEIHVHGEEGVPFDSESIERDELLNSYEFSSLDFDRIDVLMTEEPQLECAPLSSSSRLRYFEPLNENLEPSMSENLDNLFWYMSSCPSKGLDSSSDLSEADIVVLEGMYEKCPKPTLTKIHEFAKRLLVSEQVVYWWFVQRRNLTKMEETRDGSKVIVISSQEFVPSDEIIKSDFKVSSEKSEKYSCKNISDSVANSRQSDSTNKNELSTSARLASCKKKNSLSSHQRLILLNEFKKLNFISQSKAKAIAADIGVPLRTVKTWFHKRRQLLNIAEPANLKPITEMLSPNQLVTLELEYRSDQKVTKLRLQELAARLNVSLKSIILWFKERKQQTVQLEKPQQLSEVINENVQPLSKMEE